MQSLAQSRPVDLVVFLFARHVQCPQKVITSYLVPSARVGQYGTVEKVKVMTLGSVEVLKAHQRQV